MGIPSAYTDDLAAEICARLAHGESLRQMCLTDDKLPSERSVYRWLTTNADFRAAYSIARSHQSEALLEDIFEIADKPAADAVAVADKRVRIDTRKWAMGHLTPMKYGERTLIGSDPENPLPAPQSDTELARLIVFHLSKASKAAD